MASNSWGGQAMTSLDPLQQGMLGSLDLLSNDAAFSSRQVNNNQPRAITFMPPSTNPSQQSTQSLQFSQAIPNANGGGTNPNNTINFTNSTTSTDVGCVPNSDNNWTQNWPWANWTDLDQVLEHLPSDADLDATWAMKMLTDPSLSPVSAKSNVSLTSSAPQSASVSLAEALQGSPQLTSIDSSGGGVVKTKTYVPVIQTTRFAVPMQMTPSMTPFMAPSMQATSNMTPFMAPTMQATPLIPPTTCNSLVPPGINTCTTPLVPPLTPSQFQSPLNELDLSGIIGVTPTPITPVSASSLSHSRFDDESTGETETSSRRTLSRQSSVSNTDTVMSGPRQPHSHLFEYTTNTTTNNNNDNNNNTACNDTRRNSFTTNHQNQCNTNATSTKKGKLGVELPSGMTYVTLDPRKRTHSWNGTSLQELEQSGVDISTLDPVVVKRIKNTDSARRSRQKKMAMVKHLEVHAKVNHYKISTYINIYIYIYKARESGIKKNF
jgi:hypothetical protein